MHWFVFQWRRISAALLAAIIVMTANSFPARANVIKEADARGFHSIQVDLGTATKDITQTMLTSANDNQAFRCLEEIHSEALFVGGLTSTTNVLLTMSALMKNRDDEALALFELRGNVQLVLTAIESGRDMINNYMGACPQVATANVKGQAVLDVFGRHKSFLQPVLARIPSEPN
jgi:hypothetical protein